MLGYLILLFTLVPIIELALLIRIGGIIGALNTVSLVIITGVGGAILAKWQGMAVLSRIRQDLEMGMMPADKLFDGVLIFCGGVLLLTPGFLTDGLGFFLLVPFGRKLVKLWLKKKIRRFMDEGRSYTFTSFRRF